MFTLSDLGIPLLRIYPKDVDLYTKIFNSVLFTKQKTKSSGSLKCMIKMMDYHEIIKVRDEYLILWEKLIF